MTLKKAVFLLCWLPAIAHAGLTLDGYGSVAAEVSESDRGVDLLVGVAPEQEDIGEHGAIYVFLKDGENIVGYLGVSGPSETPSAIYFGKLNKRWGKRFALGGPGSTVGKACRQLTGGKKSGLLSLWIGYSKQNIAIADDPAIKAFDRLINFAKANKQQEIHDDAVLQRKKYLEASYQAAMQKGLADSMRPGYGAPSMTSWNALDIYCD